MSSVADAELGVLFVNARETVYIFQILEALGHKQPNTTIPIDNLKAVGIATKKVVIKASKAMEMHFNWFMCREVHKSFPFFWSPGPTNNKDYPSKHHPGMHHCAIRPKFLTP